ncbi:unnamed protein product [marine sediment metagenome]|uniref:Uncharacterized protein n=1 Tax=marine sediment metagenome TaxID=412755 RepID=X1VWG8_9ZZZZ
MSKFKGMVTHQTVSDEDFKKIMSMPAGEIDNYSNVNVEVVKDTNALYNKMAKSIANVITENNKKNESTKIILPVGPTPQYPISLLFTGGSPLYIIGILIIDLCLIEFIINLFVFILIFAFLIKNIS